MAFEPLRVAPKMSEALLSGLSWGSTEHLTADATIRPALQPSNAADARFVIWIQELARLAESGVPQWTVVALSLSWFCWDIWQEWCQPSFQGSKRKTRLSYLTVSFEILAELLRMAAIAISCIGPWTTRQVANLALITTVFVFGLSGFLPRVPWRRVGWWHSNWSQLVTLMLLAMQDLLPGAIIGAKLDSSRLAVSRVTCVALSFLITVALPRQPTTPPPVVLLRDGSGDDGPAETETCSLFSYVISYDWLTPPIWRGSRRPVTTEDLPKLPWYEQPSYLLERIERARKKHPTSSLLTILSFMRAEMFASAIWVSLSFASEMISPFALYQLLNYLSNPADAAIHPAVWVGILFLGPWFRSVSWQRYLYHSTHQAMRVKAGFTLELYRRATQSMEVDRDLLAEKSERAGPGTAAAKSARTITATGQMANLMASDIDAVINSRDIVQSFAGVPVGTTLAMIGLYRVLGWSAFVGIAVILVLIPVPTWMSQLVGKVQRKVKRSQDSRISLISEYLQSIRTVKMFGWEDIMISKVAAARDGELAGLWRVWVYWLLMSEATELIPMFALLSVFVSYVVVAGATLTAPVAFTTMSLIMILRKNLNMLTRLSRNITNAIISLERLDKYFNRTVAVSVYPEGPLSVQQATFRRSQNASFWLRDVSIDFVQGGLNAVLGPSGSGKTTLLLAILGETTIEGGRVTRPRDAAFASQTPWLQRSSIRDNILFYNAFDKARYESVLDACCLIPDLERLAHGDSMLVGENGAGLSGGQQSRVALARALYSYAPLLLLDDIFSALDSKTAAAVWERCFCSELLRGRTVVLVTQLPWIEAQADLAIRLEQGAIASLNQNLGVKRVPVTLAPELGESDDQGAANRLIESSANGEAHQNGGSQRNGKETKKQSDLWDEMQAGISHGHGRLLLFQYLLYFGGPVYAVFSILIIVASNAALIGMSLWLSRWVDAYRSGGEVDIAFYLSIYACFSIGVALINGVSFLTYANGSWVAAKRLHEMFIESVMYVPLAWYKNVPVGRVVNRFSRDMDSLDSKLNRMVLLSCDAAVRLVFRLGAISSVLPIFVLPSFVICSLAVVAGEMYTRTAVVVRRLSSAAQSPVFSQFSDTLNGLPVIRARRDMPELFERKLAESMAEYTRNMQSNYDCNRWVGVRCDFAGAVVALCAGTIAVWKAQSLSAGLVGFSLTAAANISETILVLIRSLNDLEVELTSVSWKTPTHNQSFLPKTPGIDAVKPCFRPLTSSA
jgi:ABC-type multidrug transport system fused ATPase/permease subunit